MKALFLKIFVFDTKSLNCEISACVFRCGPLLSAGTASAFDAQDVLVQVLRQDVADLTCLALARGMPTLSAKDGFSRPSLKPVPASSSNALEYASSAQGNKEVYINYR